MATKSIAWETGSGYISLEYTGQGNGTPKCFDVSYGREGNCMEQGQR